MKKTGEFLSAMPYKSWNYEQRRMHISEKKNEFSTVTGSSVLDRQVNTVGSKIIRTLEIIRVKNFIPNVVLRNKYLY